MRIVSLYGDFNSLSILGNVGLGVRRNRGMIVVKPSNSNGDALLHYLGYVRSPASNGILCRKMSLASVGIGVGERHRGVKVIFRRFGLFGGGAIVRGVVLSPILYRGHEVEGLHHREALNGTSAGRPIGAAGRVGRRTRGGTLRLLSEVKLTSGTSMCPSRLSNNRGRHITVIHTLTVGPSIVLFSRPADTLSPRVMNRILRIVERLTGRNVAVIIIARRVNFTHRINSEILFVSSKGVLRRGTPRRLFAGPRGPELRRFLSGILWGILAGRVFNVVVHWATGVLEWWSVHGLIFATSCCCFCFVGFFNGIDVGFTTGRVTY